MTLMKIHPLECTLLPLACVHLGVRMYQIHKVLKQKMDIGARYVNWIDM